MLVLGIETSCDETAVGIVDGNGRIRAEALHIQNAHAVHGGVVPEIAARAHGMILPGLLTRVLDEASVRINDLDGIAATCGPGLIGGVMVGMVTGKTLAMAARKPFLAVNHLEAHILTARLGDPVPFPFVVLLVSGGHTQIILARDLGDYQLLGTTLDDAAGECFDKVAKLLGLGYPGGPALEKLAQGADYDEARRRFPLPLPLAGRAGCDLSFSGLKTAARLAAVTCKTPQDRALLAASLQGTIADHLCAQVTRAIAQCRAHSGGAGNRPLNALVVAGGVAANTTIRARLGAAAGRADLPLLAPPPRLCTDNGVMIAWAGLEMLRAGRVAGLDHPAYPRWPLAMKGTAQ